MDESLARTPHALEIALERGLSQLDLECSAMSTKYLGEQFDLHGGGMDLEFPHHENEIAQNAGCCGVAPVGYWMHGNMFTINGQKMSKNLGNSILPHELFSEQNNFMSQPYSPMSVRFFMLQTHYRSTLNFSDAALLATEKGYKRLMNALQLLP